MANIEIRCKLDPNDKNSKDIRELVWTPYGGQFDPQWFKFRRTAKGLFVVDEDKSRDLVAFLKAPRNRKKTVAELLPKINELSERLALRPATEQEQREYQKMRDRLEAKARRQYQVRVVQQERQKMEEIRKATALLTKQGYVVTNLAEMQRSNPTDD